MPENIVNSGTIFYPMEEKLLMGQWGKYRKWSSKL